MRSEIKLQWLSFFSDTLHMIVGRIFLKYEKDNQIIWMKLCAKNDTLESCQVHKGRWFIEFYLQILTFIVPIFFHTQSQSKIC